MVCSLCPRRCMAQRGLYTGSGRCGQGTLPRLARAALHFDEEPCISGTSGSGAVFFSGCPLKCVYCQNYAVSHGGFGALITPDRLREIYFELISQGAKNINLVSGTPFLPAIIESLRGGLPVPVVWNSSGYETVETVRALKGYVDIYLPDLKYMDSSLAATLSGAEDYPDIAPAAIAEMLSQTGPAVFGADGLMKKGTLIRHLVLPNHLDNTRQVLRRIRWDFGDAYVSLMAQYVPMGEAHLYGDIARPLSEEEYEEALEYMQRLGLDKGYTQALSSASSGFTPAFDLTGVKRCSGRQKAKEASPKDEKI